MKKWVKSASFNPYHAILFLLRILPTPDLLLPKPSLFPMQLPFTVISAGPSRLSRLGKNTNECLTKIKCARATSLQCCLNMENKSKNKKQNKTPSLTPKALTSNTCVFRGVLKQLCVIQYRMEKDFQRILLSNLLLQSHSSRQHIFSSPFIFPNFSAPSGWLAGLLAQPPHSGDSFSCCNREEPSDSMVDVFLCLEPLLFIHNWPASGNPAPLAELLNQSGFVQLSGRQSDPALL